MPFKIASTFTGIFGLDWGFHARGAVTTAMVEKDVNAQKVLAHHFPTVPLMGDICNVSGSAIGRPDALVGGFPCTNISKAAPVISGLDGDESGLFYEFARLVGEYLRLADDTGARWLVLENADNLVSSNGGRDLALVARGLEELGYGWAYRVVDAGRLGTPQRRLRTIVVGHRGGDPVPAGRVLGLLEDGSEDGAASDVRHHARNRPPLVEADAGRVRDGVMVWRKSANARASLAAGGYETWVPATFGNTLTCRDGGGITNQKHIVLQDGRLRTLTVTEWERLQGFPDGWTDVPGNPPSARWKQLGNAVHTGTSHWVADRLMAEHAALPQIGSTRDDVPATA